ncbi:hypothetical protein DNI29_02840 [Hymenobacter sediminis]|uniref:SBBP repeat-containing protein n=1 Tax=Hymenobacter sediminis TaxID=2218621 RepID=UPI000DA6A38A|nr:SBBP repeat-containing protein [Hymenobacter sediminis]RPD49751.1 hypothetical protein DNI29_02840 [Hymenobacter sediminis]
MKTLLLFLLLLGCYPTVAQINGPWVQQLTGPAATVSANNIITDAVGNSYVTGTFTGTANFGSISLSSRGTTDLFLAKYTPAGQAVWATQIGRDPKTTSFYNSLAIGTDVSLDAAGNVYVVGSFAGVVSYGNGGSISSFDEAFNSGLLVKFGSNGQVKWLQRFGIDQYSCNGRAIATDAAGNSYITGSSDYGGIHFGNQTVGGSRRVMYVACYTTNGAVAWAKVSGNYSSFGASGADVALDGRNNCLVGGTFTNDITLGGKELTTSGTDCYLASFNAKSGSLQWLRQGGGAGRVAMRIQSLSTDAQGNIYVAGDYSGAASLGGQPLISNGGTDQFLARYTRTGTLQWVEGVGTSAPEYSSSLVTTLTGSGTLVGQRLNVANEPKILLHHFRPDGSIYASETYGTSGSCRPGGIAQDWIGRLYLAGTLTGTASFGRITVATGTRTSGFVARLNASPVPPDRASSGLPTLEVYPNPVHGQLTARLPWPRNGMLVTGKASLHNAFGTLVATQPVLATDQAHVQATFNCAQLPPGIYALKLSTPDGTTYSQSVEVK